VESALRESNATARPPAELSTWDEERLPSDELVRR